MCVVGQKTIWDMLLDIANNLTDESKALVEQLSVRLDDLENLTILKGVDNAFQQNQTREAIFYAAMNGWLENPLFRSRFIESVNKTWLLGKNKMFDNLDKIEKFTASWLDTDTLKYLDRVATRMFMASDKANKIASIIWVEDVAKIWREEVIGTFEEYLKRYVGSWDDAAKRATNILTGYVWDTDNIIRALITDNQIINDFPKQFTRIVWYNLLKEWVLDFEWNQKLIDDIEQATGEKIKLSPLADNTLTVEQRIDAIKKLSQWTVADGKVLWDTLEAIARRKWMSIDETKEWIQEWNWTTNEIIWAYGFDKTDFDEVIPVPIKNQLVRKIVDEVKLSAFKKFNKWEFWDYNKWFRDFVEKNKEEFISEIVAKTNEIKTPELLSEFFFNGQIVWWDVVVVAKIRDGLEKDFLDSHTYGLWTSATLQENSNPVEWLISNWDEWKTYILDGRPNPEQIAKLKDKWINYVTTKSWLYPTVDEGKLSLQARNSKIISQYANNLEWIIVAKNLTDNDNAAKIRIEKAIDDFVEARKLWLDIELEYTGLMWITDNQYLGKRIKESMWISKIEWDVEELVNVMKDSDIDNWISVRKERYFIGWEFKWNTVDKTELLKWIKEATFEQNNDKLFKLFNIQWAEQVIYNKDFISDVIARMPNQVPSGYVDYSKIFGMLLKDWSDELMQAVDRASRITGADRTKEINQILGELLWDDRVIVLSSLEALAEKSPKYIFEGNIDDKITRILPILKDINKAFVEVKSLWKQYTGFVKGYQIDELANAVKWFTEPKDLITKDFLTGIKEWAGEYSKRYNIIEKQVQETKKTVLDIVERYEAKKIDKLEAQNKIENAMSQMREKHWWLFKFSGGFNKNAVDVNEVYSAAYKLWEDGSSKARFEKLFNDINEAVKWRKLDKWEKRLQNLFENWYTNVLVDDVFVTVTRMDTIRSLLTRLWDDSPEELKKISKTLQDWVLSVEQENDLLWMLFMNEVASDVDNQITFMQKLAKQNPEAYSWLVVKDWLPALLKEYSATPDIKTHFAKVITNKKKWWSSIAWEFSSLSPELQNSLEVLHTKYRTLPDDVSKVLSGWEISDRLKWLFTYSDDWLENIVKTIEQHISVDAMKIWKDLPRWNKSISQVLSDWVPENIAIDNVLLTRQGKNIDIEVDAMVKKFNEQIDKGCL